VLCFTGKLLDSIGRVLKEGGTIGEGGLREGGGIGKLRGGGLFTGIEGELVFVCKGGGISL